MNDKIKQFTAGSSAGALALFIIFTIMYPNITDNADAIVDLKVSQGVILTNIENQGDKLDSMDVSIKIVDSKLNKVLILLCKDSTSALCN